LAEYFKHQDVILLEDTISTLSLKKKWQLLIHFMLAISIHIIIRNYGWAYYFWGQLWNCIFKRKVAGFRHLQVKVRF